MVMMVCLVTVTIELLGTVCVMPESVRVVIMGSGAEPVIEMLLPAPPSVVLAAPPAFPAAATVLLWASLSLDMSSSRHPILSPHGFVEQHPLKIPALQM